MTKSVNEIQAEINRIRAQAALAQQGIQSQGMAQYGGGINSYPQTPGFVGGGAGGISIGNMGVDPFMEEMETKKKRLRIKDLDVDRATIVINKVLKTNIVPFLWGPPGIGKSSLVREICVQKKWELIDLRLSLLNPVDLRGLPVIDKKNQVADWYPPAFLPKYDTKKTGILFLDEINLAPLSVQAAAYQLILDKRVGEYRFPPHWKIVAAGNRETDKANVYKLSAPLANRFVHFNIVPNLESWTLWAKDKVRPEIINFLAMRPSLLLQPPSDSQKAFPSPRSWQFCSDLIEAYDYNEEEGVSDDLQQMIIGTIGEGVGKEFIAYLSEVKVQMVGRMINEFIKTGKITLPKQTSSRYAIIMAVFDSFIKGKISQDRYDDFKKKLSGEERATMTKFEAENADVINKKRQKHPTPDLSRPFAVLTESIDADSTEIPLNDATSFAGKELLIFDKAGNVERIKFRNADFHKLKGVTRGLDGVKLFWPIGSYVQSL